MSSQVPPEHPLRRLALVPFLFGLGLCALGLVMILRPLILIQVLVLLLGVPVLLFGVYLILFGLDLWRGLPELRRGVRIGKWRIGPDDE